MQEDDLQVQFNLRAMSQAMQGPRNDPIKPLWMSIFPMSNWKTKGSKGHLDWRTVRTGV